jgi:hypothetical protein
MVMSDTKAVYWLSPVGGFDDFDRPIVDEFVDGATRHGGMWGIMTPESFRIHSLYNRLGTGFGQRYKKQADGRWLKVEG